MKHIVFVLLIVCGFLSCKKSAPEQAEDNAALVLKFDNVVGTQNLQLNTATYTTASGEPYTVTAFDYYISNIRLANADGSFYTVPKDSSYFLIRESQISKRVTLNNVPAGDYTGATFTIGVDSLKSTAPLSERTGVLDPDGAAADMYWNSNAGYIFLKMEGTSPVSTTADKKIYYHIGGFGGYESPTINNLKTVTVVVPQGMAVRVRKGRPAPEMHIYADAGKVLDGATPISIVANSTVMFTPFSQTIANNYAGMFSIDHIHNE
jgi:hypothetical protein